MENKTIIFLVITAMLIVYFFRNLYLQISKDSKINEAVASARNKMNSANKEKAQAKNNLLKEIENQFGGDIANNVSKSFIWNGMPDYLLLVSMGKAGEIKENFFKGTRTEKWYYGEKINRLGNLKYNLEITVENHKIVGWRDLY
jgi:hypothetical protein